MLYNLVPHVVPGECDMEGVLTVLATKPLTWVEAIEHDLFSEVGEPGITSGPLAAADEIIKIARGE